MISEPLYLQIWSMNTQQGSKLKDFFPRDQPSEKRQNGRQKSLCREVNLTRNYDMKVNETEIKIVRECLIS